MSSELQVIVEGQGPRVVLVHGSVMGADLLWGAQTPLADRWTLVEPNRRGFGSSPPADGEDFDVDASDIAELIEDGDHLVGLSYGGVIAMLAAAKRVGSVASLTVLEPPAFSVTRGDEVVEEALQTLAGIRERHADDLDGFVRAFADFVGSPAPLPDPLPPPLLEGARMAFNQRGPEEAQIPVGPLRDAGFPILVVAGDGHACLQRVCDVLERELGAERAYVGGVGHMIPFAGPPLNDALEAFWKRVN